MFHIIEKDKISFQPLFSYLVKDINLIQPHFTFMDIVIFSLFCIQIQHFSDPTLFELKNICVDAFTRPEFFSPIDQRKGKQLRNTLGTTVES